MKKAPKKLRKQYKQAEILLNNLAKALNACQDKKIEVKLQQGTVFSKYGYVLQLKRGWVVRMLQPSKFEDDFED